VPDRLLKQNFFQPENYAAGYNIFPARRINNMERIA